MDKYVFYYKGDDLQAIPKNTLSRKFKTELIASGFKKHPFEVMAESRSTALSQLTKDNEANLSALRDFSGNILILALLAIPTFIVIVGALFFYY